MKALIVENLKGRNTPMSQSAIRIIAKELSVCNSLASPAIADLFLMTYTESGNMLIMTFAHARASGDGSLINGYVRTKLLLGSCRGLTKPDSMLS